MNDGKHGLFLLFAGGIGGVFISALFREFVLEKWYQRNVPYASRRRRRQREEDGDESKDVLSMVIDMIRGKRSALLQVDKEKVFKMRKKWMSKVQTISYENTNPLLMIKAYGSYMYDEKNNKYLDTRNNVCHVGHSEKNVARAVADQVAILNTNTRYLHPNVTALAKRIVETMPKDSEIRKNGVVFFVNSGSEANDLALRMSRNYACQQGIIVLDGAYHGHTYSTIEISPYKYNFVGNSIDSKGKSLNKPKYVQAANIPDTYRGRASAKALVTDIERAAIHLENDGHGLAAIFVESFMSVAGVIVPPPTYLQQAFKYVRKRGGVCICDEIQTGLGRTADTDFPNIWYAFERHQVEPDIVTLGKPLGNGMPIACVVTTRKIADAFATGPEYFNTFGGNPVCCAAALVVLDLVEDSLRKNAIRVGTYLKQRLTQELCGQDSSSIDDDESFKHLVVSNIREREKEKKNYIKKQKTRRSSSAGTYSSDSEVDDIYAKEKSQITPPRVSKRPRSVVTIGDVRGAGLYLGIEFVTNFASRQPATAAASLLCSALVQKHQILTSLDGPYQNVLVIKPPLCFSKQNAATFINALKTEMLHLDTLPPEYLAGVAPTPT